jgi:hypothetical protein
MRSCLVLAMLLGCGGAVATSGGSLTTDAGNPPSSNPPAPSIQAFQATPAGIAAGESVQLLATFSGGTGIVDRGVGTVQSGVPVTVSPAATTTYTLIVTAPDGATSTANAAANVTAAACAGNPLLNGLGKNHLLAGASMADPSASATTWDARYIYLAGGLFSGQSPCSVCDTNCSPGDGWWGCYNSPPGQYVKGWIAKDKAQGQIPWFTYYEINQTSGATTIAGEVAAVNDATFTTRVLADLKFLFQQIGNETVFVHVEPDFWGFAQQVNPDPTRIPAKVEQFADCAGQPQTLVGFSHCIIGMARKYSPNVRIGLHGSAFATGVDVSINSSASVDVAAEGRKLGTFLKALGADGGDFIAVDASDRDSGYYASITSPHAWDAANQRLPDFHQAFAWAQALSETTSLPIIYWQVPVGNAAQGNTANHWKDNRVDYFYSHTSELAAAHIAGMLFGAGDGNQTTPETDGGNLLAKQRSYSAAGQAVCQ